ncbi:MAG: aminoacyl-histidine dipeptidase [Breznakibacter sp.]
MGKDITKLTPTGLWESFYDLTQIPRPSKREGKAIDFVEGFGKSLGYVTIRDEVGNVIIRKPATPGMENRKGIILQGHIDMVPQKNSDKQHDFDRDPIETIIDAGWVRANGTTLGADNGIGVAAGLAVLKDKSLKHGPVEILVTMDEEAGMTGANALNPGLLHGDILLNLDSEDEGELYVGCAGGVDANIRFAYDEITTAKTDVAFKLSLTGLRGGHSGLDINLGRANANKLMFRFLKYAVGEFDACLASIDGGNMRNAIPRESFALVTVDGEDGDEFLAAVSEFEAIFKHEYAGVEPSIKFVAEKTELPATVIHEMVQDDLINAIQGCPNGVVRMSADMPGLVETSTNLSIVKSNDGVIEVKCLIRSSVDTAKEDVCSSIESVFRLAGAHVEFGGAYPGWKPNMQSDILKTMQSVYQAKWGKTPEVKAIHAGLECGILGSAYPNWDMISFGPTIRNPHSPDEKVDVDSVAKFWDYLVATLENVPVK